MILKGNLISFSFLFDETITQQVEKQFDAYLQYWSSKNQTSNIYAGFCFVGHCNSDQLFDHFHHFIKEPELNPNLLLHLGMDGPNVNLKFQQNLAKYFDEKGVSFLNIDTCLPHKVHGSFKHGVKSLPTDIDQFTVDLHGFFKLSSAQREDYKEIEDVTDVTSHYALRHSSVRWLTLKFVLVRIIEQ